MLRAFEGGDFKRLAANRAGDCHCVTGFSGEEATDVESAHPGGTVEAKKSGGDRQDSGRVSSLFQTLDARDSYGGKCSSIQIAYVS